MTCGTISGYTTHHVKGELRCQDCKDAVAAYERRRRRDRGISPPGVAECGTYSGFTSHNKRRETPCRSCMDAHNKYQRRYRAKVRLRERRGTIRNVVDDYVETYGPLDLRELVLLIQLRHDIGESSIRRATYRMLSDGRLVRGTDIVPMVSR